MAEFSITKRNDNDSIEIINLYGYLDAHTAPQLENAIGEIVKAGTMKIVVNFDGLDYISSAGLGVFMVFIEDIRNAGGDIKLAQMKPKVYTVFDLLGFPMLFDIVDTESEAITRFNTAAAQH